MATRSPVVNVMAKASYKAARRLVRDFGEVENLQVSRKGPADFVSTADHQAERTISEELRHARPGWGLLLEEGKEIPSEDSQGRRWIVDPLDGTTNFLHGLPHFAISIAFEERGRVVAGTVYDPVRDELFWAERGQGTYLNDSRLRVSGRSQLSESLIATGAPFMGRGDHEKFAEQMKRVMGATAGIRRFGAAALDLAYVAAGRFDGFWEESLRPWDIAAGILLVEEAGGLVTDFEGRGSSMESGDVVASSDRLHRHLLDLVSGP
jgi:myo-inositol-1(or 4)-monophosphatase